MCITFQLFSTTCMSRVNVRDPWEGFTWCVRAQLIFNIHYIKLDSKIWVGKTFLRLQEFPQSRLLEILDSNGAKPESHYCSYSYRQQYFECKNTSDPVTEISCERCGKMWIQMEWSSILTHTLRELVQVFNVLLSHTTSAQGHEPIQVYIYIILTYVYYSNLCFCTMQTKCLKQVNTLCM